MLKNSLVDLRIIFISLVFIPFLTSEEVNLVEFDPGNIPLIITMPHTGDITPPDVEEVRQREDAKIHDEPWIEEVADGAIAILEAQHGIKPYRVRALFARHRIDANRDDQTGPPDDNEAYEDPDAKVYYDEYHNRVSAYIQEILEKHGRVIILDTHGHGHDPEEDLNVRLIYRGTRNGDAPSHLITAMGWGPIVGGNSLYGVLDESNHYTIIPDNDDLPGPNYQPEQIFAGGWSSFLHGSESCQNCNAFQIEIGRNSREPVAERQIMSQYYAEGLYRMYTTYIKDRVVDNVASNEHGEYTEVGVDWKNSSARDNYPVNSYPSSKARISKTEGEYAQYDFDLAKDGIYEVYAWWSHKRPDESDPTPYPRNENAKYSIIAESESVDRFVNQSENGGQWNLLHTGWFTKTNGGRVVLTHENSTKNTVAEAVKMRLLSTDPNYPHRVRNIGDTSDMIIDRHVPGPWSYQEIGDWGITTSPDHHGPYDVPDSRSRTSLTVGDKIHWRPDLQSFQAGYYHVYAWWSNVNPNDLTATLTRDPQATFRIYHAEGVHERVVNQKYGAGQWVKIGTVPLSSGNTNLIELERTNDSEWKTVGDAIKLEFIGETYSASEGEVHIVDMETPGLYEEGNVDDNVPDWLPTSSQNNFGPYPDSRTRISRNGGDYIEWTLEQTGAYTGRVLVETWWGNLKPDGVGTYSRDEDATFEILINGQVETSMTWNQKFDAGQWNQVGEVEIQEGDQVVVRIEREDDDPIDRRTCGDAVRFTLTGDAPEIFEPYEVVIDKEDSAYYEEGNIHGSSPSWSNTSSQNNYGPYPDSRSRITEGAGDFVEWTLPDQNGYEGYCSIYTWWGNLKSDGVSTYSRDEDAAFEILVNGQVVAQRVWNQKFEVGQWNLIGEVLLSASDQVEVRVVRDDDDATDRKTTADAVKFSFTGEEGLVINQVLSDMDLGGYEEGNIHGLSHDWVSTSSTNNHGPYPDSRTQISDQGGDYIKWNMPRLASYSGQINIHTWWGNLNPSTGNPYSRDEDATFEILVDGQVVGTQTWNQSSNEGQWNLIDQISVSGGELIEVRVVREDDDPSNRRTTGDAVWFELITP